MSRNIDRDGMQNRTGDVLSANPEMTLLGDRTPGRNRTRVMVANRLSSAVRPADLDAFLRGYFKG